MRYLFVGIAILILGPLAFAQLDSNSVTVLASRNTTLQADQVVFAITVDTPIDVPLNDVVAALQNAGITLSNLAGVRTPQVFTPLPVQGPPVPLQPQQVEWAFGLPVPIAKLTDTAGSLTTVQQTIAGNNHGWTMSFNVQGTQVSLAQQQSQACSIPDLISDARAQAQKLASAAGMSVGNVLALSSGISTIQPGGGVFLNTSIGAFISTTQYLPPQICSATVKFALK